MIDSLTATTSIIFVPIIVAIVSVFLLYKRKHNSKSTKKYMYFVAGFVLLTAFFIAVPDPSLIQTLYVDKGDYTTPMMWSVVSAVFLFFCIYTFKKHEES